MCSFTMTLGDVPDIIKKFLVYEQDFQGGQGAGVAWCSKEDPTKIISYHGIPAPKLTIFTNIYQKLGVRSIGNTYQLFTSWVDLPNIDGICAIHTRKVSMGTITYSQTQPFNNKEIIMCHKGTIYNYKEIALELEIKLGENDSQTLFNAIVEKKHVPFLQRIEGKAIVAWWNINNKGSIYCACISDSLTENTDLFYATFGDKAIVSIGSNMLYNLCRTLHTKTNATPLMYKVPIDTIIEITKTKMSRIQNLTVLTKKVKDIISTHIGNYEGEKVYKAPLSINRLVEDYLIYYFNGIPVSSPFRKSLTGKVLDIEPILVTDRGFVLTEFLEKGKLVYYKQDGSEYGNEDDELPIYKLYFYKGVLMRSKRACEIAIENGTNTLDTIANLSYYPICEKFLDKNNEAKLFMGINVNSIHPIFSREEYHFHNLVLIKKSTFTITKAVELWQDTLNTSFAIKPLLTN